MYRVVVFGFGCYAMSEEVEKFEVSRKHGWLRHFLAGVDSWRRSTVNRATPQLDAGSVEKLF